jgi:Transposase IS66 family
MTRKAAVTVRLPGVSGCPHRRIVGRGTTPAHPASRAGSQAAGAGQGRQEFQCAALAHAQGHPPHGRRLQKRYAKIQDHVVLFLEDGSMSPTNNSSEQAIRMSAVFRKVTNGVRSAWGRDLFAAVRSVVNTGTRHGLSALQSIQRALSPVGSLFGPA